MSQDNQEPKQDPVEAVVKYIHIMIPVVGAALSFMLAFIAITIE